MTQAPVPTFAAAVDEQGRLHAENRSALSNYLRSLAGQRVTLTVKKYRKQRTSPQSRYYYGVVVALLAEHLGYDRDEMHQALAFKFLALTGPDDPLPRRRSTADLNTAEMTNYIEAIRTFAASELGCYIPDPNEIEAAA